MTVTIDIPDRAAGSLRDLDVLRKEIYEDFVLSQRQKGELSLGEAAELLGVSYAEVVDMLGARALPLCNIAGDEATAGRATIRGALGL